MSLSQSIQNANVMSQAPPTRSESPLATVKMEGKVELGSQMGKQEPSLAVKNEKKLLCDDDDIPLVTLSTVLNTLIIIILLI